MTEAVCDSSFCDTTRQFGDRAQLVISKLVVEGKENRDVEVASKLQGTALIVY
jgi:hypothetical protein